MVGSEMPWEGTGACIWLLSILTARCSGPNLALSFLCEMTSEAEELWVGF